MKKSNYDGAFGWLRYIIDYPYNKIDIELFEGEQKEDKQRIKRLKNQINNEVINRKIIEQEKDGLLKLRDDKIQILSSKLSEAKIDNATKQNVINILNEQLDDAEETIEKKILIIKQLNMRYAQAQRKIQKLEKEAQKNEHRINFLKSCKDAPSKEKVLAYEKCMKEVEKRQKAKCKTNI